MNQVLFSDEKVKSLGKCLSNAAPCFGAEQVEAVLHVAKVTQVSQ